MDEVMKMLRAVINGQSSLKQELLGEIGKVRKEVENVDEKIGSLDKNMKKGFQQVNKRIDKLGSDLAFLEEDAPTRGEHDELEKKVTKLETRVTSNEL